MEKIVARLRVERMEIEDRQVIGDQVVNIRANGRWDNQERLPNGILVEYPISVHLSTFPGCGAVPVMGDKIQITIEVAK